MTLSTNKIVYVPMAGDYIHIGHINIIKEAKKHGRVVIGLMTDEAIASYKRVPLSTYNERKEILENIEGISEVIPEKSFDFIDNIKKLKPDYMVHGDDWKTSLNTRQKVIETLEEVGGKLIEIPYTRKISSTGLIEKTIERGVTPDYRRLKLRKLIELKPVVRVLEAHNGLSALVTEKTSIRKWNEIKEFDAMWASSLTDSSAKGKPDIEVVDFTSRTQTINEILEVTTKPIIVDGDTGGLIEHFVFMVKTLDRLGVSAIIIEDKKFPKRNSLLENAVHIQESIDNFCEKIKAGKKAQITKDFMIIARIESLIARHDLNDAIKRAKAYINVGVDAIMIHSKDKDPKEIIDFCQEYKTFEKKVPLVVVPTTYNQLYEEELKELGVSVIIYANALIRASYKSMKETAEMILKHNRFYETEQEMCCSLKDLFNVIGEIE